MKLPGSAWGFRPRKRVFTRPFTTPRTPNGTVELFATRRAESALWSRGWLGLHSHGGVNLGGRLSELDVAEALDLAGLPYVVHEVRNGTRRSVYMPEGVERAVVLVVLGGLEGAVRQGIEAGAALLRDPEQRAALTTILRMGSAPFHEYLELKGVRDPQAQPARLDEGTVRLASFFGG